MGNALKEFELRNSPVADCFAFLSTLASSSDNGMFVLVKLGQKSLNLDKILFGDF